MRRWLPLPLLAFAACRGEVVHGVTLQFGTSEEEAPLGFQCREGLRSIALDGCTPGDPARFEAQIVIDFVRTGGLPQCRPQSLLDWCEETSGCEPLADLRWCETVAFDVPGGCDALDELRFADVMPHSTVLDDAPDEPVIVRAVLTTEPCDAFAEAGAGYDRDAILGCVYSCPVVLRTVDVVELDLDSLDGTCGRVDLDVCANGLEASAP